MDPQVCAPNQAKAAATAAAQAARLDALQLRLPLHDLGFIEITGMLLSDFGGNPY